MFTSKWWNLCWESIVLHILNWYTCDLIMFHIDIEGKCGWIWEGGGGGGGGHKDMLPPPLPPYKITGGPAPTSYASVSHTLLKPTCAPDQ